MNEQTPASAEPEQSADRVAEPAGISKGDRATIGSGHASAGVSGVVFWIGENKYGSGMRYGLRSDEGETYWVDDAQISTDGSAPASKTQDPSTPSSSSERPSSEHPTTAFKKGDTVTFVDGADGADGGEIVGEVFWAGSSRYGSGMRYGVRAPDGQTHWVDDHQIKTTPKPTDRAELVDPQPHPSQERNDSASAVHLPPEAFEQAIPDDEIPF